MESGISDHRELCLVLVLLLVTHLLGWGLVVLRGGRLLGLLITDLLLLSLLVLVVLLVVLGGGSSVSLSNQPLVLLGQGRGSGQMVSDGTETVLIGDVVDRVLLAIISLVGVVSLGNVRLLLGALILDLSLFDHLDSVGGLIAEFVARLGLLSLELDNWDVLVILVLRLVLATLGLRLIVGLCLRLSLLLLVMSLSLGLVGGAGLFVCGTSGGDDHKGGEDDKLQGIELRLDCPLDTVWILMILLLTTFIFSVELLFLRSTNCD